MSRLRTMSHVSTPKVSFDLPVDPESLRTLRDGFRGRAKDSDWLDPLAAHAYLRQRLSCFRTLTTVVRARLRLALARPDVWISARTWREAA